MRYWDASAIVPLLAEQPGTELVRGYLAEDPHVVTWSLTRLEIAGAIERRARQGALAPAARIELLARLGELGRAWDEVSDLLPVLERGLVLMARHPLRSAAAAQLAAASLLAEGEPASVSFVCLDRRLAEAARREGFVVLGWPAG